MDAWPVGFNTNDMPNDPQHHIDFFFRAGLCSEELYARVMNRTGGCADLNRPDQRCQSLLKEMAQQMGDFTKKGFFWDVYNIYDSCPKDTDDDDDDDEANGATNRGYIGRRRRRRHGWGLD